MGMNEKDKKSAMGTTEIHADWNQDWIDADK